jgi:hypothetical protein
MSSWATLDNFNNCVFNIGRHRTVETFLLTNLRTTDFVSKLSKKKYCWVAHIVPIVSWHYLHTDVVSVAKLFRGVLYMVEFDLLQEHGPSRMVPAPPPSPLPRRVGGAPRKQGVKLTLHQPGRGERITGRRK